jgi:hypothetical protein
MGRRQSLQARSKATQYRHSPEGRMARHYYLMRPEVQMRNALKRAMKHGHAPAAVNFGAQYKVYKPTVH